MPKDNNIKISKDEEKILKELIKDSRQTPHEIAQKLGFSRQKVWRAINRLEKNNTIWGYTTVINQNSRGYNYYFALCKAKAPIFDTIDQIINAVKEKKADKLNVNFLGQYYLHGTYDWLIVFLAKDISDAKKFCGYIQKEYTNYIDRVELLENVFTLVRYGKLNPNLEKFKEFAVY